VTGFRLRSGITEIETIASARKVRLRRTLDRLYGKGRWRKLKGRALVELPTGRVAEAEVHWYEALASAE
jgi:hypothetical protein